MVGGLFCLSLRGRVKLALYGSRSVRACRACSIRWRSVRTSVFFFASSSLFSCRFCVLICSTCINPKRNRWCPTKPAASSQRRRIAPASVQPLRQINFKSSPERSGSTACKSYRPDKSHEAATDKIWKCSHTLRVDRQIKVMYPFVKGMAWKQRRGTCRTSFK